MAVKRSIGSGLRRPVGDPQRRWILVAGRPNSVQPFWQDEGVGAEEQRQRRQLGGIPMLYLGPHHLALFRIELDLECVEQPVHLLVFETRRVVWRDAAAAAL